MKKLQELLEQLRSLDPNDPGRWPLAIRLGVAITLFGDEIHVMRKTVVDGSNTGGFQRTCVVSHGGSVEVQGKRYGIQQISLEENAARNIGEDGNLVKFRIDRLGIPLMGDIN